MPPRREGSAGWLSRSGLGPRLLVAQALVLLAGGMTSWVVATAVGPGLFHEHLGRAGVTQSASESAHVEAAFTSALLIAVIVALVVSVLVALGVTWYLTRRVQRSVADVADVAGEIAEGGYALRVPSPGLGTEFDQLAVTVNHLAETMESVEATRRRMLADLAHEMRTPLATIDAHLEALEDGVLALDETTLPGTLHILRGSTQRLGRLAQDITAVSRAQEGRLEMHPVATSPEPLMRAAVEAAGEAFAGKGVHLVLDIEPTPPVRVDPERMAQVLGNLLDNALRHTPAGGVVTLSTRRTGPRWVEVAVADTGDGIASDALGHVFDRFYRADSARDRDRGGSGIGLTISKAIVEAHGGRITAHSPGPGSGASFTLRIPVVDPAHASSREGMVSS